MKTLNKEDRNQYIYSFPNWIARFIPNLYLTTQGLLLKTGKNDRLVWDGSFQSDWESVSVNMILDRITEHMIVYGDAFDRYLIRIWNLCLTHPDEEIYLFDDDAKGAFRYRKYHSDVASAFAFSISSFLMIPLGNVYDSIVSPQDWEPFARARTHLAEALSRRRDLYAKYRHIIDRVEFSSPPTGATIFVKATPNTLNTGVQDFIRTTYNMFDDESLFDNVASIIQHAMAASIEALYLVLGFPDERVRQNPLSLDKYFQSIASFRRVQLGKLVNKWTMSVSITDVQKQEKFTELTNWPKKRKGFTLLQSVTLCGNFKFWAITRPWDRFFYLAFRSSVNDCIRACSKITKNKRDIKIIIETVAQCNNSSNLQARFPQRYIAKEIYSCTAATYINKILRSELKIIKEIFFHPLQYNMETYIAHIVHRDPDFVTFGDACLEAAGGFSEDLKF